MPDERERASIARIVNGFMDQHHVPGFSLAISRYGQIVYQEGFGFADKTSGELLTRSHRFRIASISKPVTSVAVFTLIEQGRLDLHSTVFGPRGVLGLEYGEDLAGPVREITIYHLLTHTCGGWGKGKDDPMFNHPAMNHHELIAWTLHNQPLDNAPGERFAYSNFGYCVLGRVLEKISGRPYADGVQRSILAQCGIKDMQISGNTREEKAPGEVVYYGQNGENPYGMNVQRMDSHGGWIATPTDLVQFAMHADGFNTTPSLLSASGIRVMTTPSRANPNYACGWAVNQAQNRWHSGSLPGTSTILVHTHSGLCWAGFANTRGEGIDGALDKVMWTIAGAVPAWQA